jgi:histidinol-phosphatase
VRRVSADLELALSLADLADAVSLPRFRAADLRVETKPDLTPVSEADRAVEDALRERIARDRPGETMLGEEEGGESGDWIVDPIDATKNYVRGIPLFATLIALEGRVAVVSAPALGRRWWAARGEGAFADGGRQLRVSRVARVEDCVLTFTSPRRHSDGFWRLVDRCWAPRGFGDFWQYMLLAEGAVDLCVEAEAKLWDLAAPKLIVEEAGGRLTSLRGEDTAAGGDCLASNGALHAEALAELGASQA